MVHTNKQCSRLPCQLPTATLATACCFAGPLIDCPSYIAEINNSVSGTDARGDWKALIPLPPAEAGLGTQSRSMPLLCRRCCLGQCSVRSGQQCASKRSEQGQLHGAQLVGQGQVRLDELGKEQHLRSNGGRGGGQLREGRGDRTGRTMWAMHSN